MTNQSDKKLFVIWSIEHTLWWRPGWMGYTPDLAEAGQYTEVETHEILTRTNLVTVNECRIPLAYVQVDPLRPSPDTTVAIANDARDAYALYSAFSVRDLEHLQAALTRDAEAARSAESVAFCAGRLALVALVLRNKEKKQ